MTPQAKKGISRVTLDMLQALCLSAVGRANLFARLEPDELRAIRNPLGKMAEGEMTFSQLQALVDIQNLEEAHESLNPPKKNPQPAQFTIARIRKERLVKPTAPREL